MRRVLVAAALSVPVLVAATVAPTLAASAAPDGEAGQSWKSRSYVRHGVSVSEISNGKVTARVYGGRATLVAPKVGAKEALLEVRTKGVGERTPSAYDQSVAAGMSPEEACEFARDLDPYGCAAAPAPAAARPAAFTGSALDLTRSLAPTSTSESDFLGSICYDFVTYEGDGSKHVHGCNSRYHDAWTTNYRWIANKMKATGWSVDPGWYNDRVNGVGIQARYNASDSYATDWDPYTTETLSSSCRTVTTSATGKSGAGYSTSQTVCPDKLSPFHSPEFQYFGAKWTGDAAPEDERRGVVATSVHRIPRSQGYSATTYLWVRWN
jgi:hypothetical protein